MVCYIKSLESDRDAWENQEEGSYPDCLKLSAKSHTQAMLCLRAQKTELKQENIAKKLQPQGKSEPTSLWSSFQQTARVAKIHPELLN